MVCAEPILAVELLDNDDVVYAVSPDGNGLSAEDELPVSWSGENGVDWTSAIPGPAAS